MKKIIDLRSDTVTHPTPKMRDAMMNAVVGDDCYGEDPTVQRLEELAAEKIGKEAAMYVPTGTMGNTAAILAHTHSGEHAIMDIECHIYYYENGAMASLAGIMPILTDSEDGCPEPDFVEPYLARNPARYPKTSLICLENTHNRRGGRAMALDRMSAIHELARRYDVAVHLDGARVFNAAYALGVDVKDITAHVDSVMFCLSKGLCAPVGSMVAGDAAFIERARLARRRLGGGMRQSGVLAAAGIVSLSEMTDRLGEDHENAKLLAKALSRFDPLNIRTEDIHTNMVFLDTTPLNISADEFAQRLAQHDIRISVYGPTRARLVTNHDVSREEVLYAAEVLVDVIGSLLNR
jgi:threonine aldolase